MVSSEQEAAPGPPHHPFGSARNAVFFIAEIGGNHGGDLAYAHRLNALAIASGADAVKHQIYTGDSLVSEVTSPDRNAHFKTFELGLDAYLGLADECDAADVQFMASTWDVDAIDAVDARVSVHKVGSGDLTCHPILQRLARTGKPLILSTGLSTLDEVAAAVDAVLAVDPAYADERKLALLQCTSSYPCPDEDVNLDAMVSLRDRFGLPVGYSDHSEGSLAVEAAVALGAEIIEAHFTDTREGQSFRDHMVSFTLEEVRTLLPRLATIRRFKGDGIKRPTPAEVAQDHVTSFRRSLHAAADLPAGHVLQAGDLTLLRPATGLAAWRLDDVVGRRLTRPVARHDVLVEDHLA